MSNQTQKNKAYKSPGWMEDREKSSKVLQTNSRLTYLFRQCFTVERTIFVITRAMLQPVYVRNGGGGA